MNSTEDSQYGTLKAKKAPTSVLPHGSSGPTTFFLRSEKELEKGAHRGRKTSRDLNDTTPNQTITTTGTMSSNSSYGVQSLEDTMRGAPEYPQEDSLSRTNSNVSEHSVEAVAEDTSAALARKKRKAGNPVHPKIHATGQRIISSEHNSQGSPVSLRSAESPYRTTLRRNSTSNNSISLSQPLTPLRLSPQREPLTPRSGSPKSFRLSDEEASIASETGSHAVQSSGGEEDEEAVSGVADEMPQLVMPSISMPARRPFTAKGKRMGRMKIMVIGGKGVGKTRLIQSICRVCEDIVHLDPVSGTRIEGQDGMDLVEIAASTRPYPTWWTDLESRRMMLRRKSIGSDNLLERNLTFVDTPACDTVDNISRLSHHFKTSLARTTDMARMNDSELINLLSGEGGYQVDVVLYLLDPAVVPSEQTEPTKSDEARHELLRYLCKWTSVIPLITRSDTVRAEELVERKKQVADSLHSLEMESCTHRPDPEVLQATETAEATDDGLGQPQEPYAVSSAPSSDLETMDASLLMSSTYLQPLVPSELDVFVSQLLDPENMSRLRHLSATKFLLWRQQNLGLVLQKHLSPLSDLSAEPCKDMVRHRGGFRSTSPSTSDNSCAAAATAAGASEPTELPFRQLRLAKWAQDLQRSLHNESKRYLAFQQRSPSASSTPSSTSPHEKALATAKSAAAGTTAVSRPARGRLGGEIAVVDPLGVLAFSEAFKRQGWRVMRVASGVGLMGAVMWWVARNWAEVQEFFLGMGLSGEREVIRVVGVPAPERGWGLDDVWGGWRK